MTNFLPVDPERWGPPAWDFLYCVAFSYPYKPTHKDRDRMLAFLKSMGKILPCKTCRKSFRKKISKISNNDLKSKETLVLWLMETKNDIARKGNKKLDTYNNLCKKYHLDKLEF